MKISIYTYKIAVENLFENYKEQNISTICLESIYTDKQIESFVDIINNSDKYCMNYDGRILKKSNLECVVDDIDDVIYPLKQGWCNLYNEISDLYFDNQIIYVAWLSNNHEHVNSDKVIQIEASQGMSIYEFLGNSEYNFGKTKEEAEKILWDKVRKADEIRKHFGN